MRQSTIFDPEPTAPKPPREFFTRGHVRVDEAQAGEVRAGDQNEEILAVFRARPTERLTPWDVFTILECRYPVTSVRRALTTMAHPSRRLLVHHETDRRPSGPYQAMSGTWSLRA